MSKPLFRVNPETLLVSYNRAKKILGITSSVYNKLSSLNSRRIKNDVSAKRILRDVLIPEKEVAGSGTTLKYILVPFWKTALGCNDVSEKMAIHALSLFAEAPFESNLCQSQELLPENLAMFIKVIVLADHQVESTDAMKISDQVDVFSALWGALPKAIKDKIIVMTTVEDDDTRQLLSVILLLTQLSALVTKLEERGEFLTEFSRLLSKSNQAFKKNMLDVVELLLKNIMPQLKDLTALLRQSAEFITSLLNILNFLKEIKSSLIYCVFPQCFNDMADQAIGEEDIKNAITRQLCLSLSKKFSEESVLNLTSSPPENSLPENLAMFIKVIVLADHQVKSTRKMEISEQVGVFSALWGALPEAIKDKIISMTTVQDDDTRQLLSVISLLTHLITLVIESKEGDEFLTEFSRLLSKSNQAFKKNMLDVMELLLKNKVMPQPEHLTALLRQSAEFITSLLKILNFLIEIESGLIYCVFPQCFNGMADQAIGEEDIKNAITRQLCLSLSENDDSDPRLRKKIKVLHKVIILSDTEESKLSLVCQLIRDATCKIDESEVGLAAIIDNKHENRRIKLLSSLARMLLQEERVNMIREALKTSPTEGEGASARTFTEEEIGEITTAITTDIEENNKKQEQAAYATAAMIQQPNDGIGPALQLGE